MVFFRCWFLALFLCALAKAEQPIRNNLAPGVPRGVTPLGALPRWTKSSGYIFSGTVLSVEHITAEGATGIAATQITFQVENAVRGARDGQKLKIKEWAGLWQSGERYRPGERVALFLYPPSKLGFTSPVGGRSGRFRVDSSSRVMVEPARRRLFPTLTPLSGKQTIRLAWDEFARAIGDEK